MSDLHPDIRPYTGEDAFGRFDTSGIEWRACDPYPTWYRWVGDELITDPGDIEWADGKDDDCA